MHRKVLIRIAIASTALFLVAFAAAGWLSHRANQIRTELTQATALLSPLKSQLVSKDVEAARVTLDKIEGHTEAAARSADDVVWKAASALPVAGPNFSALSEITLSTNDVVNHAAQPLLRVFESLDWDKLTPVNGRIDVAPLAASSQVVASSANTVDLTYRRLAAIDREGLLTEVAQPLGDATEAMSDLSGLLNTAADASRILPAMLGTDGTRNYLVLMQNNAEVRATGGLPGALALMHVEDGVVSLGTQTSGSAMKPFIPPVEVDQSQQLIYTSRLGAYIGDVNLTPDFPSAAMSAKAMWERRYDSRIDGVLAMDPVVLAHILEASGPMPVGSKIGSSPAESLPAVLTSANVVKTLLSDVYATTASNDLQDAYFASVSQEIFRGLTSGKVPVGKLIPALDKSIQENRLYLWSDHKEEQKVLHAIPLGGAISRPSAGSSFGVYFNDGTGAKMDYYVKRTVQLVQQCMSDGYGEVKVRITSTNTAPADAATSVPAYVTGGGIYGVPPGTVRTNLIAYGPVQSNVETASVDGHKVGFAAHHDANRPVGTVTVSLTPGQSSTVEMTFGKIVQHAEPNLVVTPTVQPVKDVVLPTEPAECTREQSGRLTVSKAT